MILNPMTIESLTALEIQNQDPALEVILVTKDINMRLKALGCRSQSG